MNASKKAVLLMLCTAFLWSLAGVFIKITKWDALAIVGGRSFFAALTMFWFIRKQKIIWDWPLIGGALAYTLFTYCIIVSTSLTTSANAVMMQYTAPIYVAFLSGIILKEKIEKVDWLCIGGVLVGMGLFFMHQTGSESFLGNIIGVGNGISFAFIAIFMRIQKNRNPEQSIFIGSCLAAIIGIPFVVHAGMPPRNSVFVLAIAGFVVSIAYKMYSQASKNLTAIESVMMPVIDPILNPLWVFLMVGEKPGILSLCGGGIVLIAITGRALLIVKRGEERSSK